MQAAAFALAAAVCGCCTLLLSRRWVYVCLCALMEAAWVCTVAALGLLALIVGEATTLYWGLAALVFAAVELCIALFLFVVWADVRGGSY